MPLNELLTCRDAFGEGKNTEYENRLYCFVKGGRQ